MRKPRAKILLVLLILVILALAAFAFQTGYSAPQSGPMKIHVDPDLQGKLQELETRLDALRQEHHVPALSVAVVKGQEVVYLKGLGTAADGRTATPDTAYTVPSMNRRAGQTWTVRDLAHLDVLVGRGGIAESRPYLAWHAEGSGDSRLQWSSVCERDGSVLYLKAPERGLALILLASGPVEKSSFSEAFVKTFLG
jgi:predicted transcriptional regulator